MSAYQFTQRAVASPDAPLKPLLRKRARSGGETWVQVTRRPDSRAKKPRLGGSQQPACAHTEHHILSITEAAAFAAQFWDEKTHPTKALQHEFLATCIDVDLEQNVKHAGRQSTRERGGTRQRTLYPTVGLSTNLQETVPALFQNESLWQSVCTVCALRVHCVRTACTLQ